MADGLRLTFDPKIGAFIYPATTNQVEVFGVPRTDTRIQTDEFVGGVIKMSLHTSQPLLRKVPKFSSIEEADRWLDGE